MHIWSDKQPHLVAMFQRRLSDRQARMLAVDPWQLFWRDHKARLIRQGGQAARKRRRGCMWLTATQQQEG